MKQSPILRIITESEADDVVAVDARRIVAVSRKENAVSMSLDAGGGIVVQTIHYPSAERARTVCMDLIAAWQRCAEERERPWWEWRGGRD